MGTTKVSNYDPAILQRLPAIVKAYQLPDTKKAVIQILNSFLPFVAIWVAMYLLLDVSVWITLALSVVNAFFLVRIFIIQHDCGHQAFTGNRKANDIIGEVCSIISFMPYRYWAKSHNFHHGHNGILWEHRDIGDINLLTVNEFRSLSRFEKARYLLFRSAPVLFLIGPAWYLLIQNRFPLIRLKGWEHAHKALIKHNLILIGFYVAIIWLLGYKAFLLVHLPILLFFAVIAVWFFYVQHQHETSYKEWKEKWEYIRAAIQGSTYYKLPRFMHWLTGNIGYHHIHHLNPLVPNYELARCHHENPVFEQVANKITFWQSLRCIFNKLWDEDQERMISFREYMRRYRKGK
ncbi:MAG: fatty acid desaturase [Lewinellaceae bacterium]|jgi:omega-6 fatty acid desaturase (delta-12 desaturase)|nr:fatty acid desaturase [Lewinellaceae bacterium]